MPSGRVMLRPVEGVALIAAGTVLAGRYEIMRHIASGGMGDVWQGWDRILGRTVAVKLLRTPSDELGFIERFWAEARAMATISHPGVVEVYDFGDDPAVGTYLIMKYIDGESLARVLDRGPLTAEATMRLVAEAAEALHAAHEKGVMHRDVKPGNLLIRPDGSTVLTDFGIARSATATHQTSAGLLLGTASYIAPERAGGQPATAQSDIYSLGVVAYRCLAGRLPFEGESVLQVALRHANDEPPPLPDELPPGVREDRGAGAGQGPGGALALRGRPRRRGAARDGGGADPAGDYAAGAGPAVDLQVAVVACRRRRCVGGRDRRGGRGHVGAARRPAGARCGGNDRRPGERARRRASGRREPEPGGDSRRHRSGDGGRHHELEARRRWRRAARGTGNLKATPVSATTIRLEWTDNSANESGFDHPQRRRLAQRRRQRDHVQLGRPGTRQLRVFQGARGQRRRRLCVLPGRAGELGLRHQPARYGSGGTVQPDRDAGRTDHHPPAVDGQLRQRERLHRHQRQRVAATPTPNAVSYSWDGLTPGTYMCFKVRAFNAAGVSGYSPAAQDAWACTTTPLA